MQFDFKAYITKLKQQKKREIKLQEKIDDTDKKIAEMEKLPTSEFIERRFEYFKICRKLKTLQKNQDALSEKYTIFFE